MGGLLVVAGEASGDRAAARIVSHLEGGAFGMGGEHLRRGGMDLVADLRTTTAMGIGSVAARAFAIGHAFYAVLRHAKQRRPDAALLVNYTDFNLQLARRLSPLKVPVFWYIAPQIWAWRRGRAKALRGLVDRMFVILPFEERLWREAGVDAEYVGHPSLELTSGVLQAAKDNAIAILPGSRPHEVRRLLPSFAQAAKRLFDTRGTRCDLFLSSSLDAATREWAERTASAYRLNRREVSNQANFVDALAPYGAALVASGTASLEAALAGASPIVAYRVDRLTAWAARRVLHIPDIALPNILLGRRAVPEVLQSEVTGPSLASLLERSLDEPHAALAHARELRSILGNGKTPSLLVAARIRARMRSDA